MSRAMVSSTNRVSSTRTRADASRVASVGRRSTASRPSGNSTSAASYVWSTVTTTYPWLASSSTRTVPVVRALPPPGPYSTTGRPPRRGRTGAPRPAWVGVPAKSTTPVVYRGICRASPWS
ncbi:hypothetical protein [Micromonospora zhanjiangensis]